MKASGELHQHHLLHCHCQEKDGLRTDMSDLCDRLSSELSTPSFIRAPCGGGFSWPCKLL